MILLQCPVCLKDGFTTRGLLAHNDREHNKSQLDVIMEIISDYACNHDNSDLRQTAIEVMQICKGG